MVIQIHTTYLAMLVLTGVAIGAGLMYVVFIASEIALATQLQRAAEQQDSENVNK